MSDVFSVSEIFSLSKVFFVSAIVVELRDTHHEITRMQ